MCVNGTAVFNVLKGVYISRMTDTTHGGARRNAGRKTELPGDATHRVQVTVDEKTLVLLRVLGGGNLSRGVRRAARAAYDAYQREP